MSQRNILFVVIILVIFAVGAAVILPKKRELSKEQKLLKEKQEEAAELNRKLTEVSKINSELEHGDPRRLEQAARDDYKYCKPNEKIYSFPEKENSTPKETPKKPKQK